MAALSRSLRLRPFGRLPARSALLLGPRLPRVQRSHRLWPPPLQWSPQQQARLVLQPHKRRLPAMPRTPTCRIMASVQQVLVFLCSGAQARQLDIGLLTSLRPR